MHPLKGITESMLAHEKTSQNNLDGNLKLIEIPTPLAGKGHIVNQTLYSLISTGTELSNIDIGKKNLLQKL